MSGKGSKMGRKMDRRVRRTRDALGDALVRLMHEKPFEEITVQHVLERAQVGRSTFYSHFSDKDDLFLSDVEDFFEAISTQLSRLGEVSERVAPVCELFAHVADARKFYSALIASRKIQDVLELGQGHFARGIEQRLTEIPRALRIAPARRGAVAHALAGALLSLMSWWIDRDMPESPEEMDRLYHGIVWSDVKGSGARVSAGVHCPAARKRI